MKMRSSYSAFFRRDEDGQEDIRKTRSGVAITDELVAE
jgi:hypothetical protein